MPKPKILDASYQFPDNYQFILDGKLRSPWYDEQTKRAATKQELAQEIDIDYAASGWQYFDPPLIAHWKAEYVLPPFHTGEILLKPSWQHPEWFEQRGGQIQLWFHPMADGKVPEGWNDISCGVDVATGKGGEQSSNSVASFARSTTGEKIAQFTTNEMFPSDFALSVLALCRWMNNALLIPERNGPGGEFIKQVMNQGYSHVFRALKDELRGNGRRTNDYGFWTDRDSKKLLFADYRNALRDGKFVNRCEAALDELGAYIFDGNKIEHSRAMATPDPTASGENHGDMVIADCLCWRGIQDRGQSGGELPKPEPAIGSFLWRRKRWSSNRDAARCWG